MKAFPEANCRNAGFRVSGQISTYKPTLLHYNTISCICKSTLFCKNRVKSVDFSPFYGHLKIKRLLYVVFLVQNALQVGVGKSIVKAFCANDFAMGL